MSRKLLRSNKKGFSLVELIITVTLLVTVLLPISIGFISAAAINKQSKEQLKLNSITRIIKEEVVDKVQSKDLNNVIDNTDHSSEGYKYDVTFKPDDPNYQNVAICEVKIKNLSGKVMNVFDLSIYYQE